MNVQNFQRRLVRNEFVNAHYDFFVALHCLLVCISRVLNFSLWKAFLNGSHHTPHRIESVEVFPAASLHVQRQPLEKVGTSERIGRIRNTGFVRDDLLRSQSEPRGMFGRKSKRLIKRIRVKRLSSSEHCRESLNCNAHNIVIRLLRGKRAPRCLCVEAQNGRTRIPTVESLCHHLVPDIASRTVFGDLLKEIIVRIEKEREPRCKRVDIETGSSRPFHIFDAVIESERQLLKRCRAGFADMVAAD